MPERSKIQRRASFNWAVADATSTAVKVALPRFVSVLASLFLLTQVGFGQSTTPPAADEFRIRLSAAVDDAFIQAELTRIGSMLAEHGQLLPRTELLKARPKIKHTLPAAATHPCDETELAAKCRAAVVVVARMARIGVSNSSVAVPATGFFIATNGVFVTSSHLIHEPDHEGIIVLTGDGRVLPVRATLADDETNDVAILKADGAAMAALPLGMNAEMGSRIGVMSHPVGRFFTFTQGTVTRRSVQSRGPQTQELIEISAEFGPGSSGAPVVNACGNVVGWVDALRVWPADSHRDPNRNPTLNFRECGVSGEIWRLVRQHALGAD
jgi:S1-C subfamily serine protease